LIDFVVVTVTQPAPVVLITGFTALSMYTCAFYARQLYRHVLLRARISYGNSVRPSVRLSRPGTDSKPGEIETQGFHRMIA